MQETVFFVGKSKISVRMLYYVQQGVRPVLAFSFFALIFSSLLWLMFSLKYVAESLVGVSFFDAGVANIILYCLMICLPIFLMWAVFGYVNQYIHNRMVSSQLRKLMGQMKKNQDYSDLLARALIETEQQIKDGFVLNRIDLLIADINELLAEIIRSCKLASPEQIENLWRKIQNGSKWAFGKVIVEINSTQTEFRRRIFERAAYDNVLSGTILEFCARYQLLISVLEKHDSEKMFLDMMETGILGKVYSIMSPIATEVKRGREAVANFMSQSELPKSPITEAAVKEKTSTVAEPVAKPKVEVQAPQTREEEPFYKKIGLFKKRIIESNNLRKEPERDPFSIALERSFASEEVVESHDVEPEVENNFSLTVDEEPIREFPIIEMPAAKEPEFAPEIFINPEIEPTDTQRTLDNLKKEWQEDTIIGENPSEEEIIIPAPENIAYPFGSWTNEQAYRK